MSIPFRVPFLCARVHCESGSLHQRTNGRAAFLPMSQTARDSLWRLIYLNWRYSIYYFADRIEDARLGVRTGSGMQGTEKLDEFSVVGDRRHGTRYEATPYQTLRRVFAALPYDTSQYCFVDFGSGKGRALILAARRGFRQVLGVEFAKELHEIAERNIRRACNGRAQSILCDAGEFEIPNGPCVLYLYNPFDRLLMERVVHNIVSSFRAKPRHIVIATLNETVHGVFEMTGIFRQTGILREGRLAGLSHPTRYRVKILEAHPDV